jgi:hypothetical protein
MSALGPVTPSRIRSGDTTASSCCQVINGGWGNHFTPWIEVNTPDTIEWRVNYGLRMQLQEQTAI